MANDVVTLRLTRGLRAFLVREANNSGATLSLTAQRAILVSGAFQRAFAVAKTRPDLISNFHDVVTAFQAACDTIIDEIASVDAAEARERLHVELMSPELPADEGDETRRYLIAEAVKIAKRPQGGPLP